MTEAISFYLNYLKSTSKQMLRLSKGFDSVRWFPEHFARRMDTRHLSVALYDPLRNSFPIQASSGEAKIPVRLVTISLASPLVRWFQDHPEQEAIYSSANEDELSDLELKVQAEMQRYRVEICIKIGSYKTISGYLLVGARCNEKSYDSSHKVFLKTIANHIGVDLQKEKYRHDALFDPLTGLLSRGAFDKEFNEFFGKGIQTALAMVDIDNFKKVNDQFGHPVGDQVLRIVAHRIRSALRKGDRAFRYGGEEIVILVRSSSRNQAGISLSARSFRKRVVELLERVRKCIANQSIAYANGSLNVTVSIGVCIAEADDVRAPQEILEESDQALYQSKHAGKNRVTLNPLAEVLV